nr:MAG TPA: hypothetical protein [Bacteriophage sp.]
MRNSRLIYFKLTTSYNITTCFLIKWRYDYVLIINFNNFTF